MVRYTYVWTVDTKEARLISEKEITLQDYKEARKKAIIATYTTPERVRNTEDFSPKSRQM